MSGTQVAISVVGAVALYLVMAALFLATHGGYRR
jgi:hypothetical protein